MTALTIRKAESGDLEPILALYRHLNPDDSALDLARAVAAWSRVLAHPGSTILIGSLAGEFVSSCTLLIIPNMTRGAAPYALIENVVTHGAHRRKGYGQAVLAAAVAAAREVGCYKVMLMTGSRQEGTLEFYEKAGFKRDKTAFTIRLI